LHPAVADLQVRQTSSAPATYDILACFTLSGVAADQVVSLAVTRGGASSLAGNSDGVVARAEAAPQGSGPTCATFTVEQSALPPGEYGVSVLHQAEVLAQRTLHVTAAATPVPTRATAQAVEPEPTLPPTATRASAGSAAARPAPPNQPVRTTAVGAVRTAVAAPPVSSSAVQPAQAPPASVAASSGLASAAATAATPVVPPATPSIRATPPPTAASPLPTAPATPPTAVAPATRPATRPPPRPPATTSPR
jgi:hypothetical protein